ncbi:MAG: PAS domain-containing protein [Pseudomonadales bacterium]
MKPKITPIDHEVSLSDNEFIVSKTDQKGIVTYVNRTFMSTAGYPESALLGKQHNIIRHPDMPRGTFKLLWDTLQKGEEFFGYVKNLCKDGSYYWVFANITPDYDAKGQLRGYYSVRRKPSTHAINTMIPIYQKMLEIEKKSNTKDAAANSMAYLNETLASLNTTYQHLMLSLNDTEEQA